MTGQQVIDLFDSIIDDSLDNTTALQLMNDVKNEIEGEREWQILKSEDASQNANQGDTYATQKTLPADFVSVDEIYLDGSSLPLKMVDFNRKEQVKSVTGYYFVDLKNNAYCLTGVQPATKKIHFFYLGSTADITLTTSWAFPARYHSILAYRMAAKFFGIDFSDISIQAGADRVWLRNALDLHLAMKRWNELLKVKGINDRRSTELSSNRPDVIN